jgi:N-acetylgalactosamine-6-sulfatase
MVMPLFGAARGPAAPVRRPNVILILADDLGYGDLGCYGCRDIRTPSIDRLAAQGVRFTTFYSNGTECTPTRAALLTGRYPQRIGGLECAIGNGNVGRYDDAIRLRKDHDLGLPVDEVTLPRLLKDAGYVTGICGKWHLGYEDRFAPDRHGFDHAFICLGGGMDYFHHVEGPAPAPTVLRLDGRPIRRRGYFTDLVAADAVEFIEANRGRPFFLYVAFTAPHAPFQGPNDSRPEPLAADSPLWDQGKAPPAVYTAMVERLDDAVGTILGHLAKRDLDSGTLVIFTSDNGGTDSARPTPFSGIKGSTLEGGIRVPCIARWPGVLPANTVTDQVAITMDLTASMARVAGAEPPAGQPFDGIDILELLEQRRPLRERTLYWRARRGDRTWWAMRQGSLKYVARRDGDRTDESLFDLRADPGEKHDLCSRRGDDAARLKRRLAGWETLFRPGR